MTSTQFQELMRHLGCLNGTKFSVIFGEEMGAHLADKFFNEYDRNAGKFIGYLDNANMRKLWKYLQSYLEKLEKEGVK